MNAERALVIRVRFLDGRYHGEPEWPPGPGRLFQALVAGAARGGVSDDSARALRWLESLPPPTVAAPAVWQGQQIKLWVPNNDLDRWGGDPAAVALIRTAKRVRPRIFDVQVPFLYAWPLPSVEDGVLERIEELALQLYQLGRGVDMAFATAEVLSSDSLASLFERFPGRVLHPSRGIRQNALPCPQTGTFDSLERRYAATLERFVDGRVGRSRVTVFQQPPKARFLQVAYDNPPRRALFDLLRPGEVTGFVATPSTRIVRLVETLRDAAHARLAEALPHAAGDVECVLVGRRVDNLPRVPASQRIRLVPLPSLGHPQADRSIRRLMVEVPAGGPLQADDVFWAFSGLVVSSPSGADLVVTPSEDDAMLRRFGVATEDAARVWRTVTPAALPVGACSKRHDRDANARRAAIQALRHAGLRTPVARVEVQREPFASREDRADRFARETRFSPQRLWHVEIAFREPVRGPLLIGDGRFLGLGLMAPCRPESDIIALGVVGGLQPGARPEVVVRAFRRAVMARVQARLPGRVALPSYVSGHGSDGQPANQSEQPHLSYVWDADLRRLLVVPPHVRERRVPLPKERAHFRLVRRSLDGLSALLAGAAGHLILTRLEIDETQDPLFAPSRTWVSRTPYLVNRHQKCRDAHKAVESDVGAACRAIGLPTPTVAVLETRGIPAVGLTGWLELTFNVAVPGPLLLGRSRYRSGGLFGHGQPTPVTGNPRGTNDLPS